MVTMNISSPERMKKRVLAQLERGNYANASDYVRDLIRKDIEMRGRLVAGLRKGEISGISPRKVPDVLAAAKRARARARA